MGTALRTIRPLSDPIVRYYLCHRRHLGHLLRQGDCDTSAQALRRAEGRIRPAHNAEAPNEPRFCERNAATVKRFQNTVLLHRLQDLTIRACVHRATRELDVVRPPIPDRRGRVPKPEVPHSIGDCHLLAFPFSPHLFPPPPPSPHPRGPPLFGFFPPCASPPPPKPSPAPPPAPPPWALANFGRCRGKPEAD